ncbi:S-methyl-5-thioribose kinase [Embleya sp. NPDC020886]|uniref:S-methyl-5-thioribose kinase n=1 Tax=Embleya sp. NPDC020886 TaxID=3363980 RepID=UPI0037894984
MNDFVPSELLDEKTLPPYLSAIPNVAERLGGHSSGWRVREIGDGNVNYVFAVHGPAGRVCVKQAMPYVRVSGESWPLTPRRAYYEYRALVEHGRHVPARLPEVLHHDSRMNLLVTEHLSPHVVLREGLRHGNRYPHLADHLAQYLVGSLFHTSDLAHAAIDKRPLVALFSGNHEMTQIMEDMIFTEIYHEHGRNRWTSPQLDDTVARLRDDVDLKVAVARLKVRYLTCTEALLHGDLHTGSILVTEDDTRVFDQEFACYGPIGFDVGTLLAHLLIGYFAQDGPTVADPERTDRQTRLLQVVEDVWTGFARGWAAAWEQPRQGDAYPRVLFDDADVLAGERERHLAGIFTDSVGFCGAEIIRRIIGMAHVAELRAIESDDARARCEQRCLRLATHLLKHPHAHRTIRDLTDAARTARLTTS